MGKGKEGSPASVSLNRSTLLGVIFIAGFCEFWAAVAVCYNANERAKRSGGSHDCKDEEAWAVAFGTFSCVLVVATIIVGKCCANDIVEQVIAITLAVGWFCVMAVCTMQSPFAPSGASSSGQSNVGDGNGFYGTWICLAASLLYLLDVVPAIKSFYEKLEGKADDSKKLLMVIAFASIIEMWQAARICDKSTHCEGMLTWGWMAGAISAVVALLFALIPQLTAFIKYASIFLSAWWICAVLSLTMPGSQVDCGKNIYCNGLFTTSSNGFFGTWVALIASSMMFGMNAGEFCSCIPGMGGGGGGGGGDSSTSTEEHHKESHVESQETHSETHSEETAVVTNVVSETDKTARA